MLLLVPGLQTRKLRHGKFTLQEPGFESRQSGSRVPTLNKHTRNILNLVYIRITWRANKMHRGPGLLT